MLDESASPGDVGQRSGWHCPELCLAHGEECALHRNHVVAGADQTDAGAHHGALQEHRSKLMQPLQEVQDLRELNLERDDVLIRHGGLRHQVLWIEAVGEELPVRLQKDYSHVTPLLKILDGILQSIQHGRVQAIPVPCIHGQGGALCADLVLQALVSPVLVGARRGLVEVVHLLFPREVAVQRIAGLLEARPSLLRGLQVVAIEGRDVAIPLAQGLLYGLPTLALDGGVIRVQRVLGDAAEIHL
mmetsp:Transcript_105047/g.250050  ORF Transcript_105047/g.250050 Transcript_105047/m.250050 type:complete len:245 (+) Transcript_105047:454-1188(+)